VYRTSVILTFSVMFASNVSVAAVSTVMLIRRMPVLLDAWISAIKDSIKADDDDDPDEFTAVARERVEFPTMAAGSFESEGTSKTSVKSTLTDEDTLLASRRRRDSNMVARRSLTWSFDSTPSHVSTRLWEKASFTLSSNWSALEKPFNTMAPLASTSKYGAKVGTGDGR